MGLMMKFSSTWALGQTCGPYVDYGYARVATLNAVLDAGAAAGAVRWIADSTRM